MSCSLKFASSWRSFCVSLPAAEWKVSIRYCRGRDCIRSSSFVSSSYHYRPLRSISTTTVTAIDSDAHPSLLKEGSKDVCENGEKNDFTSDDSTLLDIPSSCGSSEHHKNREGSSPSFSPSLPQRSLHTPFRFRVLTSAPSPVFSSLTEADPRRKQLLEYSPQQSEVEGSSAKDVGFLQAPTASAEGFPPKLNPKRGASLSSSTSAGTKVDEVTEEGAVFSTENPNVSLYSHNRVQDVCAPCDLTGMNEVELFMEHVELQTEASRLARNQQIPFPDHPDTLVPSFRRVKRHQKQKVITLSATDDRPVFTRQDSFVPLPPSPSHPWVGPHTPIGEHIIHGDGQLKVVGTGEVGFEDSPKDGAVYSHTSKEARKQWKGLKHRSILQLPLPRLNAIFMHPEMKVKHSFSLTGRGVFATKAIAKGETIMVVASTARNVGVKGELARLEEMCTFILQRALQLQEGEAGNERESEEFLVFLHDWILSGQPSSLLEHWPHASTERIIASIGGIKNLYRLELHPLHIARIAAIMDLNSFLVESSYAERKGMSYYPEAGFLNHSCVPNTTYEIMPAHMYEESDYSVDEESRRKKEEEKNLEEEEEENIQKAKAVGCKRPEESQQIACSSSLEVVPKSPLAARKLSSSALKRAKERLEMLLSGRGNELTEYGAPEYLFCCRADKDIAAGEEILISYVPQEWSFDNRQYVLHDRYRFYCKCPRCAPTIESQYARVPRLVVLLVLFSIGLQLLLLRMKNNAEKSFESENQFMDDQGENSSSKRMGFFEIMQKEQIEAGDRYPGMERLPPHITDDYVRK